MYDATDYSHSTFNDLVISGLIGIRPQLGDILKIQPLIPRNWNYFALENVPYHGHHVTVLWDRTGGQFHQGPGLHVYVDGRLAALSPAIREMNVPLSGPGAGSAPAASFSDLAANDYSQGSPRAFASTSGPGTSPADANDGQVIYGETAVSSQWTDCGAPGPESFLGVNFGAAVPVSEVRLYSWANMGQGGTVAAPAAYRVQYLTAGGAWVTVPGHHHQPGPGCRDRPARPLQRRDRTGGRRPAATRRASVDRRAHRRLRHPRRRPAHRRDNGILARVRDAGRGGGRAPLGSRRLDGAPRRQHRPGPGHLVSGARGGNRPG